MKKLAGCALLAAAVLVPRAASAAEEPGPEPARAPAWTPSTYSFESGVNVARAGSPVAGALTMFDVTPARYYARGRRSTGLMVAGIVLTGVGAVLLISGIAVASSGSRGHSNAGTGVPLIILGTVSVGVGIPLWVIGSRRAGYASAAPASNAALLDIPPPPMAPTPLTASWAF